MKDSLRFICIHGHFYQPPRENPWLEAIEQQASAHPYHDWNRRIAAECYAPNAAARILDQEGRIAAIANNYARISFNFGPTLLSWMQQAEPETYATVLQADRESREHFSGHGSALAQAYNHLIMPLASQRDKTTQVVWGVRDFQHRFSRDPEGMWLPETAVDIPTLEALAAAGIRFTILAPHQVRRVRRIGDRQWREVPGGSGLDLTMPYQVCLPSGSSIGVFFYDDPISRAVAFEGLLRDGAQVGERLIGAFPRHDGAPQLVHIAMDGETYGHHHRYGEMALAYALHTIEQRDDVRLTNYAEFLERRPPDHEVEIAEATSWSCAHGVERWRSDCGCNTGGRSGWRQAWRAPLRAALDWLRDRIDPLYERRASEYLKEPWAARDGYISVVLDRSPENVEQFLAEHALHPLDNGAACTVLKLLEMQRHAMLMYTSCGWFFDDISGIEAVQVLQYAARALQLAEELSSNGAQAPLPMQRVGLEAGFLRHLEKAPSNVPHHQNGRIVYEKLVRSARVDLPILAAHYAISSLFEDYVEDERIFCFETEREALERVEAGDSQLLVGRVRVTSAITGEFSMQDFGVLHMGGPNIHCGVRKFRGTGAFLQLVTETREAFNRADFAEVVRLFDKHLGRSTYSLRTLFRDEQRKVLDLVLASTVQETEGLLRQVYQHHAATLRFVATLGVPAPRGLSTAAEFILNHDLRQALSQEPPDLERTRALMEDAHATGAGLDRAALSFQLAETVDREAAGLNRAPWDVGRVQRLDALVALAGAAGAEVDLWRAQNVCYAILQDRWSRENERARNHSPEAARWLEAVKALADRLRVRLS